MKILIISFRLVMETTGLFSKDNTDLKFSQLCGITKDRIESFLPGLWEDLFKVSNLNKISQSSKKIIENTKSEFISGGSISSVEDPPSKLMEPKNNEITDNNKSEVTNEQVAAMSSSLVKDTKTDRSSPMLQEVHDL